MTRDDSVSPPRGSAEQASAPTSNVVPFPIDPLLAIELGMHAHVERMKARLAACKADPEITELMQEGVAQSARLRSENWIEESEAHEARMEAARLDREARREAAFAQPRAFTSIDGGMLKLTGSRRPRPRGGRK